MYITYIDREKCQRVTVSTNIVTERNIAYAKFENQAFIPLHNEAKALLKKGVDQRYTTYYKRKQNGGERQINEPDEELKSFMRKVIKTISSMQGFLFPDCMYAYIEGRETKQMANLHRDGRMFIKMDVRNFFDSCTYKFVLDSMSQVYPFCLMDRPLLEPIIKACCLRGRLAQGAPTSPILSNIAMIPFVTEASNLAKSKRYNYSFAKAKKIKSGRKSCTQSFSLNVKFSIYADDIFVSMNGKTDDEYFARTANRYMNGVGNILEAKTPLRLNRDKTRYIDMKKTNGVWVLGLMVNGNHEVTIGREKKEKFKATVFSFLADVKNGKPWPSERVHQMMGNISYYRHIEPEFIDMIIQKYNQKLDMDFYAEVKNIIYS